MGFYVLPDLVKSDEGILPTIKLIYAPSFVVFDGKQSLKIDSKAIGNNNVGIYKISFVLTGDSGLITEVTLELKIEFSDDYKKIIGDDTTISEFESTVKGERNEDALVNQLIEMGIDIEQPKKEDFSEYDLKQMFDSVVKEDT